MKGKRFAMDERGISHMVAILIAIAVTAVGGGLVAAALASQAGIFGTSVDVTVTSSSINVTEAATVVSVSLKNTGTVSIDNATVYVVYGNYALEEYIELELGRIAPGYTTSPAIQTIPAGVFSSGVSYPAIVVAYAGDQSVQKSWTIIASP